MSINNSFNTLEFVLNEVLKGQLGHYDVNGDIRVDGEYFDVYSKKGNIAKLNDTVFVGEEVEELDLLESGEFDYNTLPDAIKGQDWGLLYSGENIENVVVNIRFQKIDFDNELLIKAINYYEEYDCFYDFIDQDFNAAELET